MEFGIAALDARLESADVSFPATRADLEKRFGHSEIPYDAAGHTMPFSEALEATERQSFESEQDLLNAMHPVFEQKRGSATGILAQLRALVPF